MRFLSLALLLSLLLAAPLGAAAVQRRAQGAAGAVLAEGGRLTIVPKTSRWQQRNNCAASMNKEQPGKLDPETYAVRFANEAGVRRLCLTSAKGNEVCYRAE